MSKQSHKYITDVRSFLWGLESEPIWLELCDTRTVPWLLHRGISPVAQREGHSLCSPRQIPRAPDCARRLFQCQRKAGIFSQELWKLRLVWRISVSAQIRKMETHKFAWQEARGFCWHSRSFLTRYRVKTISITFPGDGLHWPVIKETTAKPWRKSRGGESGPLISWRPMW